MMTELATFWNNEHPLAAKADELYQKLVPPSGMSDCIVGELLRAASRIHYDWFNNGWGCNNWSGAVNYIREYATDELSLDAETQKRLNDSLNYVYEYSHGEPSSHLGYNQAPCQHVTTIEEIIVEGIMNTSPVDWMPNTVDMFDLQEADFIPDEDDDCGYY